MYLRKPILLAFLFFMIANVLHAQGPAVEWQKLYGGGEGDYAQFIERTNDGGYIIAGYTSSSQGDITLNHGQDDFWVVKIDAAGNIQWQKSLGGSSIDRAYAIHQTLDGGYIVAGNTLSHDGDVTGNKISLDYWVIKLDNNGNIVWEKTYGGTKNEYLYSLQVTPDGGYIAAGFTESNDGDVTSNHGGRDIWIVKLNVAGTIQWQKSFGGSNDEEAFSVQPSSDGGYIVAGYTLSNDGDINFNHGGKDIWVIKLSSNGSLQWEKSVGSSSYDEAWSVLQSTDGGFVVAGYSGANDGDVSGNHGGNDFFCCKAECRRQFGLAKMFWWKR